MKKKPLNLETLGEIRKPRRNEELETSLIRTKRRSERNVQLNLKVTTDFYNNLNKTAVKEQCYMVEILEKALARYLAS
jgi:hypothetical protein